MPAPRSKVAHPRVVFWTEADWEKWKMLQKETKEPGRSKPGEGINSSWMEDENGVRVHITRQQQILRAARQTWVTMRSFRIDLTVFLGTPVPTVDYFRAKLESAFLELQLCADHWKVNRLWMENYSSWNNRYSSGRSEEVPRNPTKGSEEVPCDPTRGLEEAPQLAPQPKTASRFQSCELPSDAHTVCASSQAKKL